VKVSLSVRPMKRLQRYRRAEAKSECKSHCRSREPSLATCKNDRTIHVWSPTMALSLVNHIELPAHKASGGFDHADFHPPTDRLYVAHTSNDSIDVIDCWRDRYIDSMHGLTTVAGALVSEACNLVFTSNRPLRAWQGSPPASRQLLRDQWRGTVRGTHSDGQMRKRSASTRPAVRRT